MRTPVELDRRVLIHTPVGRDGRTVAEFVARAGLQADVCGSLAELETEIRLGAGIVVLAEEGLFGKDIANLVEAVAEQPPWSDLPFVLLTSRQEQPAYPGLRQTFTGQHAGQDDRPGRIKGIDHGRDGQQPAVSGEKDRQGSHSCDEPGQQGKPTRPRWRWCQLPGHCGNADRGNNPCEIRDAGRPQVLRRPRPVESDQEHPEPGASRQGPTRRQPCDGPLHWSRRLRPGPEP